MAGQNLSFKLVLDGDNKGLVSAVKQSEETVSSIFKTIKDEADKLKNTSEKTGEEVGKIVPDDLMPKAESAKSAVSEVTKATSDLDKQASETTTKVSDLADELKQTGKEASTASKDMIEVVPKSTIEMADALTSNLNKATTTIKDAGSNAKITADNFAGFGKVSEKALGVLKTDLDQAKQKLQTLSSTNATPQDILKAQSEVDKLEKEVDQAEKAFKEFKEASVKANQELANTQSAAEKAKLGFANLKSAVGVLAGGLAALGLGLTAKEFIQTSDATQQMAARLKNATASTEEYNLVQARLLELANATYRPLSEAQEVYLATAGTMKSLGYNTEEILSATESLSLSFTHNATRADQAQSAQDALAQSMAKGSVDADAWMSIITGADNVVSDMAKSTGKSEAEIRKLGASGKASLSDLVNALIQSRDHNLELANAMENSTADAMQKVRNNLTALIGSMNEQYNISSRLAEMIGNLGNNLDWIAVLFDDVMSAVEAVSAQFDELDPSTINSFKDAIESAYSAVKELAQGGMDLAKVIWDILSTSINNTLSVFSSFTGEVSEAGEQVSFLTRVGQGLSITFGFLQDGIAAIRIVLNLLAGNFYAVASAANSVLAAITWGDVSKQFSVNADAMLKKSKEYYAQADKDAMDFESQGFKRLDDAAKTQAQRDQDKVNSAKASLDKISILESEATTQSRLNAEQRNQLQADLFSARANNEVNEIRRITDELNKLDESDKAIAVNRVQYDKERINSAQIWAEGLIQANNGVLSEQIKNEVAAKGFGIAMDESGKITVTALGDARKAVEDNAKATELAKERAKQAEKDYQDFVSQNAAKKIQLEQQIAQSKVNGDLTALKSAQDSLTQINAKEEELNLERQKRSLGLKQNLDEESGATKRAYTEASEVATRLGINLDKVTGRISESFSSSGRDVDGFGKKLELAGITGTNATNAIYLAWKEWLETAKSQVEIDFAMSKLKEFEAQGVFSTKQVEMGTQAIRQVMQKLPDDISPVEQAFESLGIKTKEQLKLAAQSALANFNTIQSSGQATAGGLRQAYERTIQAAVASGDQAVIAQTKAKAASLGLSVQIEDTGKATVQSYEEMDRAAQSHASTVSSTVTGAYREMGAVAREEAQNSIDAWNQALEAKSTAESKERSERNKTSQATTSTHYTKSNVRDELKNMGYDDVQAEKIAQGIFGSALARDQTAMQKNMGAGGLTNVTNMLYAELRKKGLTGYDGSRYIEQALQQFRDGSAQATLNTIKPKVYADSSNETSKALASGSGTGKTVQYNLNFNGKTLSLSGDANQEAMFNDLLRQLETINKSS
ncbi:tape measure protein [Acinetobacter bereziniae]|uniref:tape measure protein n=1 Tax=Acinetobacter bereziniae TaxID=106648 RepID=UPI0028136965|nr:tape measure protein [Acinetobacter bereziniae]MDQ9819266.1 tape measure protein [Acinetobacter bereziniae]